MPEETLKKFKVNDLLENKITECKCGNCHRPIVSSAKAARKFFWYDYSDCSYDCYFCTKTCAEIKRERSE